MNSKFFLTLALVVGQMSLPLIAGAQEVAIAQKGQELFSSCTACHGEQGQGNLQLSAPSIAGQSAWYISRQLNNFVSGIRGAHPQDTGGQQMRASVSHLKDPKDITVLAQYIHSLPVSLHKEELKGDFMNGSRYYQAKCGACHGGKAQGNKSFNAPKLSGHRVKYLSQQMKNFVSGIRGVHVEDKLGKQMAMMARVVSEKELNDILYFISKQRE
ncbi:c-type cytochrome [Thalassotalea atypica]|uniref:c-type cytochrome n=1 Tax=Thalassotalea atypica TaxID=2054316 RepID=UPI0025723BAF|nr:c-type cytochrome [Thalassotalea atypica]